MFDNFWLNSSKMILILSLAWMKIIFANNIDYAELEQIKKDALLTAKKYEVTANGLVNLGKDSLNKESVTIDKEWFLNKQQELLESAYKIQNKPKDNNQLLVFISMSMPKEALKELLQQLKDYNASLILQGLVDNSLPKTMQVVNSLVKEADNQGGIIIEPNLFKSYNIIRVPAYIIKYSNDVDADYDIVYGATGMEAALKVFANSKTKASVIAKRMLSHD